MRPRPGHQVDYITLFTLRELGRRVLGLEDEIARLDILLEPIVVDHAWDLLSLYGCGTFAAATLSVAAGDRPQRIRSEAAWAHLCGAAPVPGRVGQDQREDATQPQRQPARQLGAAPHRVDPHGQPPTHPHLRRAPTGRRAAAPRRSCDHSSATSPAKPSSTCPDPTSDHPKLWGGSGSCIRLARLLLPLDSTCRPTPTRSDRGQRGLLEACPPSGRPLSCPPTPRTSPLTSLEASVWGTPVNVGRS